MDLKDFFSNQMEVLTDRQLLDLKGGSQYELRFDDCDSCSVGCQPGGQACGSCQPGNKK